MNTIKRALLSVTDKNQIIELATALKEFGVELIASGGTRDVLVKNGFEVTKVESITGNPEAFDGRMKTLSFQISSALLYKRSDNNHVTQAKDLNINPIDLVVCNLYPFEKVLAETKGEDQNKLIENIDIGGPSMIRAAAKNCESVAVLTNPNQYAHFISELKKNKGSIDYNLRKQLALEAFYLTGHYDQMIAANLFSDENERVKTLRYGENPHQAAKIIVHNNESKGSLANAKAIQGKELSYNNMLDADAAMRAVIDLKSAYGKNYKYACAIIKHSNPCGLCVGNNPEEVLTNAWNGDKVSSFGSIIALLGVVTKEQAMFLDSRFVEIVIAEKFSPEALAIFAKKKNLRLLEVEYDKNLLSAPMKRSILGGELIQDEDREFRANEYLSKGKTSFSNHHKELFAFGEIAVKHLKSNGISLVAKVGDTLCQVGAGMGNPNRLVSIEQAAAKAHEFGLNNLNDVLLISDAFFPFSDNIEKGHGYGIKAFLSPGGSVKDDEVIKRADELECSLAFTGMRHFRH